MKKRIRIIYNAPVTLSFVFLCFFVTVIGVATGNRTTACLFSVYCGSWADPLTYVRLLTHVLGHSGFEHLMGNAVYILLLGPMLEEKHGSDTMVKLIVGTALVTGVIHSIFGGGYALCGSSGIVFACVILSSFTAFRNGEIPATFLLVSLLYLGRELYNGVTLSDNISNSTHILGGLIGSLAGYLLNKKPKY